VSRSSGEAEVRGDDDAGLLVELGEQMEQERTTGRTEGQISELVEDDEIEADEALGQLPGGPTTSGPATSSRIAPRTGGCSGC